MYKINDIWVDHIETAIPEVANILKATDINLSHVLVTTIDSENNLSDLRSLKQLRNVLNFDLLGDSIVLEIEHFYELIDEHNLLNGFDEVWFFPEKPSERLPSGIWITAPLDIYEELPNTLPEWMLLSRCLLGLGDGIGLNYVTTDYDLALVIDQQFV
jgi:hypothetical protein